MSMKLVLFVLGAAVIVLLMKTFIRDDLTPIQRGVAQSLQQYGIRDVDVTALPDRSIVELSMAFQGDESNAEKRSQAEAILRRARSQEGD